MVKCVCGKPMDKVPEWLSTADVKFVCGNCPDRQAPKGPAPKSPIETPSKALETKEFEEEEEEEELTDVEEFD